MAHCFVMSHSIYRYVIISRMKVIRCFFILNSNRVAFDKDNANCHLVESDLYSVGTVLCSKPKLTLISVQLVLQMSRLKLHPKGLLMGAKNQDKGLPQTPAIGIRTDYTLPAGVSENKIPIQTNNFPVPDPSNPIFWGPNQTWTDENTYNSPQTWRPKELLSIPRVVRMVVAISDPCSHTGLTEGDFTCDRITIGDGFWTIHVTHFIQDGDDIGPTLLVFASDPLFFQAGKVNTLFSGDAPDPATAGCDSGGGGGGHLNIYGDDGMGHDKATVIINGITYGDEV